MSLRLLLTILCCLPQYSSALHMGHRGEREKEGEKEHRLPFICALIFLCDGWLSYCVICAFEKCSLEQKKLPASKSYNQAQFSENKGSRLGHRGRSQTLWLTDEMLLMWRIYKKILWLCIRQIKTFTAPVSKDWKKLFIMLYSFLFHRHHLSTQHFSYTQHGVRTVSRSNPPPAAIPTDSSHPPTPKERSLIKTSWKTQRNWGEETPQTQKWIKIKLYIK